MVDEKKLPVTTVWADVEPVTQQQEENWGSYEQVTKCYALCVWCSPPSGLFILLVAHINSRSSSCPVTEADACILYMLKITVTEGSLIPEYYSTPWAIKELAIFLHQLLFSSLSTSPFAAKGHRLHGVTHVVPGFLAKMLLMDYLWLFSTDSSKETKWDTREFCGSQRWFSRFYCATSFAYWLLCLRNPKQKVPVFLQVCLEADVEKLCIWEVSWEYHSGRTLVEDRDRIG